MGIIKACEEWRPEFEGAAYPLMLITDHKNLEYYRTKKILNRRQEQWSESMTIFDYEMVDRRGKSHGKADAVSRKAGDLPDRGMNG